ncbi:MAG: SH3 domain-containing protein, partial [Anaerolineales bacterium]
DDSAGPPPTVQIVAPQSGQQAVVGQAIEVQVIATDQRGVTRLQMAVEDVNRSTKSFPEPTQTAEALLGWVPDRPGTFELAVVAFRGAAFSAPATLIIEAVRPGDAVTNPVTGQSTPVELNAADCVGRVVIGNLRVRTGPGTQFERQGNFELNEQVTGIGQNADGSWYQVRRLSGAEVWVINNNEWIEFTGACSGLPVAN